MTAVVQALTMIRGITFDPFTIICYEDADFTIPFDLTGWTPWSEVRSEPYGTLIVNLNPSITDPTNGVITFPLITDAATVLLPAGKFKWDCILNDPGGERHGPYVRGPFTIKEKITQGSPPE